jgi:hypothetical protein
VENAIAGVAVDHFAPRPGDNLPPSTMQTQQEIVHKLRDRRRKMVNHEKSLEVGDHSLLAAVALGSAVRNDAQPLDQFRRLRGYPNSVIQRDSSIRCSCRSRWRVILRLDSRKFIERRPDKPVVIERSDSWPRWSSLLTHCLDPRRSFPHGVRERENPRASLIVHGR